MQYNFRNRFLVVIIDANVYVSKYEKYNLDPPVLSFQAKLFSIGKSKVCPMTEFSDAGDKIDFDGNILLLESEDNEYVYVPGLESFKFRPDDEILDYISLTGNNKILSAIIIGEKYIYFIYNRYKFIENDKIEEGTLLNTTNGSLDPFDYHLEKCGVDSFKTSEHTQIHTCWAGFEEDEDEVLVDENEDLIETIYTNGNNEVVNIFNQKCVTYLERDVVYAFRQCGHHCICEQCYQNKTDIDISK